MGSSRLLVAVIFIIQMAMMKRFLAASMAFLLAGALVGCSKKTQYTGPDPAATVQMHFHTFDPDHVMIKSGQTVRWDNPSLIWHTVTGEPKSRQERTPGGSP